MTGKISVNSCCHTEVSWLINDLLGVCTFKVKMAEDRKRWRES